MDRSNARPLATPSATVTTRRRRAVSLPVVSRAVLLYAVLGLGFPLRVGGEDVDQFYDPVGISRAGACKQMCFDFSCHYHIFCERIHCKTYHIGS